MFIKGKFLNISSDNIHKIKVFMIQLDFFNEANEMETLTKELEKVKLSSDNVRKSIFGKIAELEKRIMDMRRNK